MRPPRLAKCPCLLAHFEIGYPDCGSGCRGFESRHPPLTQNVSRVSLETTPPTFGGAGCGSITHRPVDLVRDPGVLALGRRRCSSLHLGAFGNVHTTTERAFTAAEINPWECLHNWCWPWSSKPAEGLNKALSGFDSHTLPLFFWRMDALRTSPGISSPRPNRPPNQVRRAGAAPGGLCRSAVRA
jgi:hypothetical protein